MATTMAEIENQINKEREEFYNKPFDLVALPQWFIDLFKNAIMGSALTAHQLSITTIKRVTEKKLSELTNREVRQMNKAILITPFDKLFRDLKEGITKYSVIEQLSIDINIENMKVEKELDSSKEMKIKLAGIDLNQRRPMLVSS